MAATINTGATTPPGLPGGNSTALAVTATGAIKSLPGLLYTIVNVGTASGSITLLDSTSSTGTTLYTNTAVAAGASVFLYGFPFFNGLYVSAVSGTFNLAFT